ncbi:MAG: aminotransferase class V-fold PLP-dependent enzyme, partial [Defluviitaleaceae bacterium]|nr:aminotransferase class V-fold PLP-dependent enzyme [Defluviitaleaceae bacterium]
MQVYFDNAATTKICKEALEVYAQTGEQFFANPNSAHGLGFAAEQELVRHRGKIASLLNAPNFEVEFTSSG